MTEPVIRVKGLRDDMEGLPVTIYHRPGTETLYNVDMVVKRQHGVLVIGFVQPHTMEDAENLAKSLLKAVQDASIDFSLALIPRMGFKPRQPKVGKIVPPPTPEPSPVTDKPRTVTAADLGLKEEVKPSKYQRRRDNRHKHTTRH